MSHPELTDPEEAMAFLKRHPDIFVALVVRFRKDLRDIRRFRRANPQSFPSLPPERRRDPSKLNAEETVSDAMSRSAFPPLDALWKLVSGVCTDIQWREKYGPLSEDEQRIKEIAWRWVKACDVAQGKRTVARDV